MATSYHGNARTLQDLNAAKVPVGSTQNMISAFLVSVGFPEECEIHASMTRSLVNRTSAIQYDPGTGSLLIVRIKETEASFTAFGAQLAPRQKSTLEMYWIKAGNDEGKELLRGLLKPEQIIDFYNRMVWHK